VSGSRHPDGIVPEGTGMPAEPRSKSGRSAVPERSWDHWVRSSTFDPIRAIWMENRLMLIITAGYLIAHGLFGWFPCQHSAQAELHEQRVVTLIKELNEVSQRVPIVRNPGELP
jgi:hypothetical protein